VSRANNGTILDFTNQCTRGTFVHLPKCVFCTARSLARKTILSKINIANSLHHGSDRHTESYVHDTRSPGVFSTNRRSFWGADNDFQTTRRSRKLSKSGFGRWSGRYIRRGYTKAGPQASQMHWPRRRLCREMITRFDTYLVRFITKYMHLSIFSMCCNLTFWTCLVIDDGWSFSSRPDSLEVVTPLTE